MRVSTKVLALFFIKYYIIKIKIMKRLRLKVQFWLIERARINNVKAFYNAMTFAESIGMDHYQALDYADKATRHEQYRYTYLRDRYKEAYLRYV